jgi:hypothetical protein
MVLPAVTFASTSGYTKTMTFKAKLCQATVRDLPDSSRIDPYPGNYKGMLVYGRVTRHTRSPETLSFTCAHWNFSGVRLDEVLNDDQCFPSKKHACQDYFTTPIAGTNINWVKEITCGAVGGSGGSSSGCGHSLTYIVKLAGAFVVLQTDQQGSSPVPWVITMLEHSTFHVHRGASGNPSTPYGRENQRPQDWVLPNSVFAGD